ncbi:Ff.00g099400.m01.CDS01 [Fusarium sp. VM40]|nr:Ff.00g099400.m01.CDS01 [Fusarium sp. VM40]
MKLSNLLLTWEVFLSLQQGFTASAGSLPSRKAPSLRVHNGTLSGTFNSHYNQEFFLGVPYAAPPVGNLRLERPAPPKRWRGTKRADSYSAQCLGTSIGLSGFSQTEHVEDMSEDCLYLNVIRPAGVDKRDKLPVLVWIHGGGFFEGSASDGRLNGTFLVHNSVQMGKPLLFVSFNYRLGAFGYLSGKQVQEAGITNLGLHDQRQALVWIQENIHLFGGDPTQVTVMGESAGAASICLHLLSNGGRNDGLYSAVIAQSGNAFTPALTSRTPAQQQADFDGVLEITGCANSTDALSCLRTIPASLLREASKTLVLSFTPDGELVPRSALQALRKGHFVRVPLLMGTTRNEGTSFVQQALKGPLNTNDDLKVFIQSTWAPNKIPDRQLQRLVKSYQREITEPEAGLGTVAAYPNSELGSQYGSATLWMGDIMFTAGRRFTAQAWASFGVPSYSYFFDTVTANVNATTLGAAHFLEIPYTFGNTRRVGWEKDPFPSDPVLKQKHKVLAKTMSSMWVSFATTHSPNNYHGT